MKNLLQPIFGIIASFIGYAIGWLIDATITGNYFDSIEAFGLRGYEVGGLLAALILAAILSAISTWLFNNRKDFIGTLWGSLLGSSIVLLIERIYAGSEIMLPVFLLLLTFPTIFGMVTNKLTGHLN